MKDEDSPVGDKALNKGKGFEGLEDEEIYSLLDHGFKDMKDNFDNGKEITRKGKND